jgi:NAD-dependent SIR2 family protein deacetylase
MHGGQSFDEMLQADTQVDLFMVVGTSLKTPGMYKVVRDMVKAVRSRGGITVYLDHSSLGKRLGHLFDLHLQIDIEDWAAHAIAIPVTPSSVSDCHLGPEAFSCVSVWTNPN